MMSLVAVLQERAWQYRDSCRINPETKNSDPSLGMLLTASDTDELARAAAIILRKGGDAIEAFAYSKIAFCVLTRLNLLDRVSGEFVRLGRLFVEVGAQKDALAVHRLAYEDPLLKQRISPADRLSTKLSAAKAYRNMGNFEACLATYRDAMAAAGAVGDETTRCLIFLLIGKLYGSYRGQKSLFSSFVEESRLRISQMASSGADSSHRLQKFAAICEDALGQAYRSMDPVRARLHFSEAMKLNLKCGYGSGLIRARCHLAQLNFGMATSPGEAEDALVQFEDAIRELQELSSEERGLGIRWLQFSEMLHSVGRQRDASEALRLSKDIARLYSDHRTLVRATVVEATRFGGSLEQAEEMISSALSIAKKYNLSLHERELNSALADVHIRLRGSPERVASLLERNKDILSDMLSEVGTTLTALSGSNVSVPEFVDLSTATRSDFRARVLLDYDNAVSELKKSVASLIAAVKAVEAGRQELLILGVVNSLAREILHDLKLSLPDDQSLNPFDDLGSQIRAVGLLLADAANSDDSTNCALVKREARRLEDFAVRIEDLGASLTQLKSLLAAKIRRPRSLNTWVPLGSAAAAAIADAHLLLPDSEVSVRCIPEVEVEVLSDHGLMRNVIQQLVSNSLQALQKVSPPPGELQGDRARVVVRILSQRLGDSAVGNQVETPTLRVISKFSCARDALAAHQQIEDALNGEGGSSSTGSGFGLELAQTVFEGIMGSRLSPFVSDVWAGITVEFSPSNGKAKIVRNVVN